MNCGINMEVNKETQMNSEENSAIVNSAVEGKVEGINEKSLTVSDTVREIKQKVITEKPKVQKSAKPVEQIEEFDSDEEEVAGNSKDVNNTPDDYSKHLTYEGDVCIYTEPGTGKKLVWDAKESAWREYEAPSGESGAVAAEPIYGYENDTHTWTDPSDGTVYLWDREKNAWFPKVDEDFMLRYQLNYGFTDPNAALANSKPAPVVPPQMDKEQKRLEAKRKNQEPPTWFEIDEKHNTAIYVQGLPLDVTMEELTELFSKCGLLARDEKGVNKIKLYRDKFGEVKGDALCTYIKVESVDLALNILDGSQVRGKTLSVQRAKFQLKGDYDPSKKPKKKKKDKEKQKKLKEKLFDWRPDPLRGEPKKHERVVIIKNLFKPEDFDNEVSLLLEYNQDVRTECSKCGDVKKVQIFDRHPEGVAQVNFKDPEEAQACVKLLNGRWFGQRKISAEIWDGKTKYKIVETDAEIEARIDKWDKFLEGEEEKKEQEKIAAEKKKNEEREKARLTVQKLDEETTSKEFEKIEVETNS